MHVSFTLTVLFKFKHKYLLVGVPKSSLGSADIVTPSLKCPNIGNKTENDKVLMHSTYAGIQQSSRYVMHSTYAWIQTEVEVVQQTVFENTFFRRIYEPTLDH